MNDETGSLSSASSFDDFGVLERGVSPDLNVDETEEDMGRQTTATELDTQTKNILAEIDECYLAGALDQEDEALMAVVDQLWTKDILKVGQLRQLSLKEAFHGLNLTQDQIQHFRAKVSHLHLA